MSKWISVDEKLPPGGVKCLFYRPLAKESGDEVITVKTATSKNSWCYDKTVPSGIQPKNYSNGSCHTSHWAPLPELPTA